MCVHMSAVHLQEPISDLSDATVVQQFRKKFLDVFHLHCRRKKAFVFHYIFPPTPSLFLRFLKLSQHARTRVTLSLGADFSYKLPEQLGVQATLLFYQLPPGPDPSAVPGLSWFPLSAPPTALYMDINRGLSESEPCLE